MRGALEEGLKNLWISSRRVEQMEWSGMEAKGVEEQESFATHRLVIDNTIWLCSDDRAPDLSLRVNVRPGLKIQLSRAGPMQPVQWRQQAGWAGPLGLDLAGRRL